MQVDSYHLTPTERLRRLQHQLCLYYGGDGNVLAICPIRPICPVVSTIQLPTYFNLSQNSSMSSDEDFLHFSQRTHLLRVRRELHQS